MAAPIEQSNPLGCACFEASSVFGPHVRSVHILPVRYTAAPLISQPCARKLQQQTIEGNGPVRRTGRIPLKVLERHRA